MRALHVNSERGSVAVVLTGALGEGGGFLEPTSSGRSKHGHRRRHPGHAVAQRALVQHAIAQLLVRQQQVALPAGARLAIPQLPTPTPVMKAPPLLTADFETSVSPRLALVRAELFGAISIQMRQIGEQVYLRVPLLTPPDGGRPWISISPSERTQQATSNGFSSLEPQLGMPESLEAGFGKVVELIGEARTAVEVGPANVDGQQTIEFKAKLDVRKLLGKMATSAPKRIKRALRRAKATLDIFIAPTGLPVRTHVKVEIGTTGLETSEDILASEIPVLVTAPPASETISTAELTKLQEKESGLPPMHLSRREKKEARRFEACMNRHLGKHAKRVGPRRLNRILNECERVAQRGAK